MAAGQTSSPVASSAKSSSSVLRSPSKASQPRFFGGSSGSSRTRFTSSTSSWPTSPIHSSPSAGSNEKRQGLRRPLSATRQSGFGASTSTDSSLPSFSSGSCERSSASKAPPPSPRPRYRRPSGPNASCPPLWFSSG